MFFLERLDEASMGGGSLASALMELATKIRNYGSAFTVGVFAGAAISTGLVLGAATFYMMQKTNLVDMLTTKDFIFTSNQSTDKKSRDKTVQPLNELTAHETTLPAHLIPSMTLLP